MNPLMLPTLENEAALIRTDTFHAITTRLPFVTALHATLVVAGAHGTGKRLALMTCLNEQSTPYDVVTMPPTATAKDMVTLLYEAVHHNRDAFALRDMQDDLAETLSGPPRIIVIDGADQLSSQAAEQLHYLHARPGATWALVLLGGPDTIRAITTSAGLRGEVIAAVETRPLHGKELLAAVRAMHQTFLTPDEQIIAAIDKQICKGLLKSWARFLQTTLYLQRLAVERGDPAPALDIDLARAVAALTPTLKPSRRH